MRTEPNRFEKELLARMEARIERKGREPKIIKYFSCRVGRKIEKI